MDVSLKVQKTSKYLESIPFKIVAWFLALFNKYLKEVVTALHALLVLSILKLSATSAV